MKLMAKKDNCILAFLEGRFVGDSQHGIRKQTEVTEIWLSMEVLHGFVYVPISITNNNLTCEIKNT